ncbi:hypothetical protein [Pseudoscardovia radai]|uniref:hypothetical protein n=1 Tax=Pseudoscardovia radai TaxID=987066 RepID=UPI0039962377
MEENNPIENNPMNGIGASTPQAATNPAANQAPAPDETSTAQAPTAQMPMAAGNQPAVGAAFVGAPAGAQPAAAPTGAGTVPPQGSVPTANGAAPQPQQPQQPATILQKIMCFGGFAFAVVFLVLAIVIKSWNSALFMLLFILLALISLGTCIAALVMTQKKNSHYKPRILSIIGIVLTVIALIVGMPNVMAVNAQKSESSAESETSTATSAESETSTATSTGTESETATSTETATSAASDASLNPTKITDEASLKSISEAQENDLITRLTAQKDALTSKISDYDSYKANASEVEAFYDTITSETEKTLLLYRQDAAVYANAVLSSGKSAHDMYSDIDAIDDDLYNGVLDDTLDDVYNGLLDDLRDALYNGVLNDPDAASDYSEWSSICSNEYSQNSRSSSEVYAAISSTSSKIYSFSSALGIHLYSGDIDAAKKELSDFQAELDNNNQ